MGVSNQCNSEFESFLSTINFSDLALVELGDQDHIHFGDKCRNRWSSLFKSYVSLDLWRSSGVTNFDLSNDSPTSFSADIITNFGTSEHVEPTLGHYNCWKNVNSWLEVGGYVVSEVPEDGHWLGHGRFTYTDNFFMSFEKIGYKVVVLKRINYSTQGNLIFSILKKERDSDFFSPKDFEKIVTLDKVFNLNTAPTLNNPKSLTEC